MWNIYELQYKSHKHLQETNIVLYVPCCKIVQGLETNKSGNRK